MNEEEKPSTGLEVLSVKELALLKERFPLLFRTDPTEALKLFREQQTTFIPPPTESPFVRAAKKGQLPPKVTSGGR